jgi:hypothetical protein
MEVIIDLKTTSDALDESHSMQISLSGNIHPRWTSKGWYLCAQWKNGLTTWESLRDMKEAFLIKVAEYAFAHNIKDKIAFKWWEHDTMRRKA